MAWVDAKDWYTERIVLFDKLQSAGIGDLSESPIPALLIKTDRLSDPYVVAGDRAYLIGCQDGSFPPIGDHVPGQMGGLWAHPHKLLDGFWLALGDAQSPVTPSWLPPATCFEAHPWGARIWSDLPASGLRVGRTMLVPDGRPALLLDIAIQNDSEVPRLLDLVVLVRSRLRPGWLDSRPDGTDESHVDLASGSLVATNATGPWWVVWGSDRPADDMGANPTIQPPDPGDGRGASGMHRFRFSLQPQAETTIRFAVHGSTIGQDDALSALHELLRTAEDLLAEKRTRLATELATASLTTPDEDLNRAWLWSRCAYDWLLRDVPGVGRGLGGGFPEYPWWFSCDAAYALRGLVPHGGFEVAASTLRLLASISDRHNGGSGRIVHEIAATGEVFNPGNTQETPQFACTVLETYLWSGERSLLVDLYPLCRRGVLEWTLGACDSDHDLLPEGYGITELLGMNAELIDSSVWAHEGVRAVGRMATILGDEATATQCAAIAPRLRQAIEDRFWLPEQQVYAELSASPEAVRPLLFYLRDRLGEGYYPGPAGPAMIAHVEELLRHAETLPKEKDAAWYLGNWIVVAPLEAGMAAPKRAVQALAHLTGPSFFGPRGLYLNGIERGLAMSITTGALSAALVAYGQVDAALAAGRLLAGMATVRMPGAISEVSPDLGCFVQAWSGYGAVYPIVAGVFGLFPDAAARHLVLCPYLPEDWPRARLDKVRLGAARLDISLERGAEGTVVCRLYIDEPGWRVSALSPFDGAVGGVPRTLLGLHAHLPENEATWGVAPEVQRAAHRIELPACKPIAFALGS